MHDLISVIDSSTLSVDCVEWLNILQQIVQQLFAQLFCLWSFLEEVPAGFIIARPSAESLARRQNIVVSTYSNDIVLLSLTSKALD
ncbi:hypothetical protein F511_39116 [Dorcoceras hygrometricum]|uniref:Uncharacterized protein n=1 Tax=Dorcoceras hygrometricum TaxID=472368 RepID=A0A2Z7CIQ5_9LAMI|nr:hypothetical protein F511_39116 [Dorcoceras hygrometricum]